MRALILIPAIFAFAFVAFMPPANAWGSQAHEGMCDFMRSLNSTNLTADFTLGCLYPDQRGDNQNHICHEDFCPAARRAQIFLEEGRNMLIDGNQKTASFAFGTACHYISDALQPYHTQKSNSEGHLWFERIGVTIQATATEEDFFTAVQSSRLLVDDIEAMRNSNDISSASLLANALANKAAAMCAKLISEQAIKAQSMERAPEPQCGSVSLIQANKEACHLRDVAVSGTLRNPVRRTSQAGNDYTLFYIEDGDKLLKSFAWGHIDSEDGEKVSARGIYYQTRVVGGTTFENEFQTEGVEAEKSVGSDSIVLIIIAAAAFFALLAVLQLRWRLLPAR